MAALPHRVEPPPPPRLKRCNRCGKNLEISREHWMFRSDKSPYSAGKPYGPCKLCRAEQKAKNPNRPHGLVPVNKVYGLMRELRDRCGTVEAASKFSGINETTIKEICDLKRPKVRKHTVRLLVLALDERRRHDRRNGSSPRFIAARQHQAQLEDRLNRLAGY